MPAFFEYLRNITYYLMFATMVGIFAPAGKYRKYVSLVMGFVLLLLMVQPLAGFFGGRDIPVTQWFSGVPGIHGAFEPDDAYAMFWDNHLRGAFEAQLEAQLSRLLSANGFALISAKFEYTQDFGQIESVRAEVRREELAEPERVPFIRIQPPQIRPIRIGEAPENDSDEPCPYAVNVKNLISQFYNLPTSHIHVKVV